jgi:putative DNA primase/helicase
LKLTKSFYGKEDLELENKLLTELPGLLRQAVAALRDLLKQGYFKQPKSANDAVEMLAGLTSPMGCFVKEQCVIDDTAAHHWTASAILYDAWRVWCEQRGNRGIGNDTVFFRNLVAAVPGLDRQRETIGLQRQWGYKGIRLKTPSELDAG